MSTCTYLAISGLVHSRTRARKAVLSSPSSRHWDWVFAFSSARLARPTCSVDTAIDAFDLASAAPDTGNRRPHSLRRRIPCWSSRRSESVVCGRLLLLVIQSLDRWDVRCRSLNEARSRTFRWAWTCVSGLGSKRMSAFGRLSNRMWGEQRRKRERSRGSNGDGRGGNIGRIEDLGDLGMRWC